MAAAAEFLAEPAALAARLGVPAADPALKQALGAATARFRAAVRHPVSKMTGDIIVLDGDGSESLLLPAVPVLAVTKVEAEGKPVTSFEFSAAGILRRKTGWPAKLRSVTVTYDHGHDPIPPEVSDVVLEAAEHIYAGIAGVASWTVGGQSVTYSARGVTRAWSTCVEAYRLRRGDSW